MVDVPCREVVVEGRSGRRRWRDGDGGLEKGREAGEEDVAQLVRPIHGPNEKAASNRHR